MIQFRLMEGREAYLYSCACENISPHPDILKGLDNGLIPRLGITQEMKPILYTAIEMDGTEIGYMETNIVEYSNSLYIRELLIHYKERGKGYGKKVINYLIETSKGVVDNIEIEPTEQSMLFWEKMGFNKTKGKNLIYNIF